jgi:DNA polymerase-3 subunit alpha
MNDFVHLHVHSEYSLLDGYATLNGIVERAAELGMDSIAVTDHGDYRARGLHGSWAAQ